MMEGEEEEEAEEAGLSRGQSRDMGSLTGWQALANEVMAELGSGRQVTNPMPDDSEEPLQASAVYSCNLTCMMVNASIVVKAIQPR